VIAIVEVIGGSSLWYRVNTRYYLAYAFRRRVQRRLVWTFGVDARRGQRVHRTVVHSTPREEWFSSNDSIMALCTATGSSHAGSNAWFFARGY
jgi:hypothetical protein